MNLILGTAEFDPRGYAGKKPLEFKEKVRILNLAWEGGIRLLDTSYAYGYDDELNKYAGGFHKLLKTRDVRTGFYHYRQDELPVAGVTNASVYTKEQLVGKHEFIVPLSINNTLFGEFVLQRSHMWNGTSQYMGTYVRSVFDRGRLLKQGYTVKDCLSFVNRHSPTGIIVGVNSVKELEQILKAS